MTVDGGTYQATLTGLANVAGDSILVVATNATAYRGATGSLTFTKGGSTSVGAVGHRQYGTALVDAVGPALLIGWSEVGRCIHRDRGAAGPSPLSGRRAGTAGHNICSRQ